MTIIFAYRFTQNVINHRLKGMAWWGDLWLPQKIQTIISLSLIIIIMHSFLKVEQRPKELGTLKELERGFLRHVWRRLYRSTIRYSTTHSRTCCYCRKVPPTFPSKAERIRYENKDCLARIKTKMIFFSHIHSVLVIIRTSNIHKTIRAKRQQTTSNCNVLSDALFLFERNF